MFNNIDAVYSVIWAAVLGIAFAVIYTNVTRRAISRFVNALIDKKV